MEEPKQHGINKSLNKNPTTVSATGNSRLLELANALQSQVFEIQKYLTDTAQPNPRFEGQAQTIDFTGVDDIRSAAIERLTELHDLLLTPKELLHSQTATNLISRHAIDRFHIIDAIPITGSRTYEELARSTRLPVKILRRVVQHAMSQRIFFEPAPGHVAHTQVSRLLAQDDKTRDYYGTICEEVWPAAARTCDAIETWRDSGNSNETGYYLAHGRTIDETLERDPVKHARYDNAMGALADDRSFSVEHVVKGYNWAALGEATVVDLGGGIGTISKALAKAFPKLCFVVEDRAEVIANAIVEDSEIKDRIKFVAHDVFHDQPVEDAAVIFIRRLFMEKMDHECVEIIKALKPALRRGAVVLVQDPMAPEPGACPIWQERKYRDSDMLALALSNHGAREAEDWQPIFERAGPGFQFKGVTMVPRSNTAFVEAVWQGDTSEDVGQDDSQKPASR